ncbi:permease YjgP/YjgQ family protein [Chloroherpeton thalassium ATCC 35110]|uniref:Permease YjgP/YjgQ family protein n=1 Tax=Chloroherpeton thalassium (strain ATCC 35110 / GB-78) TaxID=517418 RepID=B3QT70_CHLT3|nr:LPS export ABC transporter permease LptG [Chloroherpeton thalassium]ACF14169.1 permease YjgP/YjgQ family protein [Chloroherpeton thalassium ATCC 35110]
MKILDRYIFREYFSTLGFAILAFVSLFILVDLIEKVDDFLDKNVELKLIAQYYLYFTPEIIKLIVPISTLLASLFVTGKLAKQTELTAMKAGGISLYRLLLPFFLVGAIIGGIDFYLSGWVVPETTKFKEQFDATYLGKTKWKSSSFSNIELLENPNRIVRIGYFNKDTRTCQNVSLQNYQKSHMLWRIDAAKMTYDTSLSRWIFYQAYYRDFQSGKEQFSYAAKIDTVQLVFSAKELEENNAALDQMSLDEHWKYIEARRRAGFSNVDEALVKYHIKISFPIACLIVILIGVPLSAEKKRSGIALEAGISLLIGFLYIILQKTFSTLGYKGAVDPILSAWIPNFLFLTVGLVFLFKAKK